MPNSLALAIAFLAPAVLVNSSTVQVDPVVEHQAQVVLITGSTDGLGREVALRVGATGAHVIVHGRNAERGQAVVEAIEEGGGSARFYAADLASFDQVRELANAVMRDYDRLDVLVNNAGIWLETPEGRRMTGDGHEMHFQVNYLSGYLLTRMLLPLLRESTPARIVNVASGAQDPIDFGDPNMSEGYSEGRAYGQSKLAQIIFTVDLAEELEGTGIIVNSLHPATLMDTSMVIERGMPARSSVDDGAAAVFRLIMEPGLGSGLYFNGQREARANAQAYDEAAQDRLRELSEAATGI